MADWGAHLRVHHVFDAHVDALYGSAPLAVMVRCIDLRVALTAHIRYEERAIVPRLDSAVQEHIVRDHKMLRESLERAKEAALLAHFRRVDARRLQQRLVELDRLLDHHDDREERDVYPPLGASLDDITKEGLLTELQATPLEGPRDACEALTRHPTVAALCDRYQGWLDERPLDAFVPLTGLPTKAAQALPKLVARDDRNVAAARSESSPRQRAHRDLLADVALLGSIGFVVEALAAAPRAT